MFDIKKLFGNPHKKALKPLYPVLEKVNSFEELISPLSDEELKAKTAEFKNRLKEKETLDDLLPEAFAVVREASKRVLSMRHFDVQVLGAIALHNGDIAEMKTGEGKTLVATMPMYLNALDGKGAHLVTVNDYLARRDAVWMGQIYDFLGLKVGIITNQASFVYDSGRSALDEERDEKGSFKVVDDFLVPTSRQEAYSADIVYGTNNEFGFDYLRDNIEYQPLEIRQRHLHFAIIDEVDSILIDEARTPLIISAPAEEAEQLYKTFAGIARKMEEDKDYTVDEKFRAIELTDEGITKAERLLGADNIYTEKGIKYVHHLENSVRAKALYHKDKEYVVRDNEIIIVDEFTGRLQPGRRWSEGMHQAIEAKEGVELKKESRTFASVTFQNFFRLYDKVSGMTGTATTSAEEFLKVYGMNVVEVPTNQPIARIDRDDLIFQTEQGKFKAVARKIKELQEKGQPVLIGTVSIEKNEKLAEHLKKEGIEYEVLNAKNHEKEGQIIAQAGRKRAVTIATNMAGRGVDIKLGGNPMSEEVYQEVKGLGGLYVIGTERHEARRIDNQLRGRSGRQGDPGETQFFVSLEDTLMRVFASEAMGKMMGRFGIPEDQPIQNKLITRSLENAQTKIEGFNFDARKRVLEYDDVLTTQRQSIYEKRRKILTGDVEDVLSFLDSLFPSAEDEEKNRIETVKSKLSDDAYLNAVRRLILQTIDTYWVEHLEVMDYTRSSVNLRAYGQRDPLIEYKKEGLRLFKELESAIESDVLKLLPHVDSNFQADRPGQVNEVHQRPGTFSAGSSSNSPESRVASSIVSQAKVAQENTSSGSEEVQKPIRKREEVGRNEKVTIVKGGEQKEVKYKKLGQYQKEGWEIIDKK